ncbi:MAG: hypothetical protein LBS00_01915, partial [Synergistaceae bacterium]|nr:hypothetical protein [Synergistaceae bacterium]
MTSQAVEIANRMQSMSDTEIEYLLSFLQRRHAEALLNAIDLKLEESKGTASLSEAEVSDMCERRGFEACRDSSAEGGYLYEYEVE